MKTTKLIITCCLLVSLQFTTNAQPYDEPPAENDELVQAFRVGFLTERLNLSVEESQAFWPVFNAYNEEMQNLREQRREMERDVFDHFDSLSDDELAEYANQHLAFQRSELEIREQYHQEFMKVLPVRKVALLYKAELEFKLFLVNFGRKKKGN
jgi:hypothetical protein